MSGLLILARSALPIRVAGFTSNKSRRAYGALSGLRAALARRPRRPDRVRGKQRGRTRHHIRARDEPQSAGGALTTTRDRVPNPVDALTDTTADPAGRASRVNCTAHKTGRP
jgi:hypothetical protein